MNEVSHLIGVSRNSEAAPALTVCNLPEKGEGLLKCRSCIYLIRKEAIEEMVRKKALYEIESCSG